jgi:hypothetical protein
MPFPRRAIALQARLPKCPDVHRPGFDQSGLLRYLVMRGCCGAASGVQSGMIMRNQPRVAKPA